jgi:hypothetical protein
MANHYHLLIETPKANLSTLKVLTVVTTGLGSYFKVVLKQFWWKGNSTSWSSAATLFLILYA